MVTDAALKNMKSKDKPYKVTDRDGMYVRVGTNGTISFRYGYRVNGRRETVNPTDDPEDSDQKAVRNGCFRWGTEHGIWASIKVK